MKTQSSETQNEDKQDQNEKYFRKYSLNSIQFCKEGHLVEDKETQVFVTDSSALHLQEKRRRDAISGNAQFKVPTV